MKIAAINVHDPDVEVSPTIGSEGDLPAVGRDGRLIIGEWSPGVGAPGEVDGRKPRQLPDLGAVVPHDEKFHRADRARRHRSGKRVISILPVALGGGAALALFSDRQQCEQGRPGG